jgi:acetate CoA/acetoacetate CoA-transferase alpha subunit
MRTLHLAEAVALIPDGASLMIGGFMAVGTPETLIDELVRQGKRDLTVIDNDTAMPGAGIGKHGPCPLGEEVDRQSHRPEPGDLSADDRRRDAGRLVPQGTLIERIRAGGFGLGSILTATDAELAVPQQVPEMAL